MNDFVKPFEVSLPDGARLIGERSASGQPVLFISGLAGTARFWQASTNLLRHQHCITFDQRGIGASSRGSDPVTISRLAHDCIAILDHAGFENAHIVGHSTGGCIAMELAIAFPQRVRSLVLSATWAGPNNYMKALFTLRKELLLTHPSLYARFGPFLSYPSEWLDQHPELMSMPSRDWSPERVDIVRERIDALLAFDRVADLPQIQCPTLVMGTRDDIVVPEFLQRAVLRLLPQAESYWFERAGHFYPVSRYEQFARLISSWVDSTQEADKKT